MIATHRTHPTMTDQNVRLDVFSRSTTDARPKSLRSLASLLSMTLPPDLLQRGLGRLAISCVRRALEGVPQGALRSLGVFAESGHGISLVYRLRPFSNRSMNASVAASTTSPPSSGCSSQ